MALKYQIVDGPSKMDLMFALFQGGGAGPNSRYSVIFRFASEEVAQRHEHAEAYSGVEVIINSLEWEDGSGESFNFSGYPRALVKASGEKMRLTGFEKARGYFRTDDRKGFIEL